LACPVHLGRFTDKILPLVKVHLDGVGRTIGGVDGINRPGAPSARRPEEKTGTDTFLPLTPALMGDPFTGLLDYLLGKDRWFLFQAWDRLIWGLFYAADR
jgi:hypothetical protein